MRGVTGPITTFIVEPFVPHKEEYYLSIQAGAVFPVASFRADFVQSDLMIST